MGEGTSAAWARERHGRAPTGTTDKDEARRLFVVPPLAQSLLPVVAEQLGHQGLLVLLTKYYLRPEQAVMAELVDDGLIVKGFGHPIEVDPADRPLVAEWLGRRRRPRSAAAVRNLLSGKFRQRLIEALAAHEATTGDDTGWRELIDVGVRSLRRMARELLAESAGYEEAVYRELLHDETADPDDTLRWLTTRARSVLAQAAALEADLVAELCRACNVDPSEATS